MTLREQIINFLTDQTTPISYNQICNQMCQKNLYTSRVRVTNTITEMIRDHTLIRIVSQSRIIYVILPDVLKEIKRKQQRQKMQKKSAELTENLIGILNL